MVARKRVTNPLPVGGPHSCSSFVFTKDMKHVGTETAVKHYYQNKVDKDHSGLYCVTRPDNYENKRNACAIGSCLSALCFVVVWKSKLTSMGVN